MGIVIQCVEGKLAKPFLESKKWGRYLFVSPDFVLLGTLPTEILIGSIVSNGEDW